MQRVIASVEEFYAHALAIEREAAERYGEFRDYFRDRGQETLAGLCASLERMESAHFQQLLEASRHLSLPAIASDRYHWLEAGSPEAPAREFFYRVAEPRHLLEIALQAENNALEFFNWVARTCEDPGACALAHEMAAEEAQHVAWVQNALEYHVTTHAGWEQLLDRIPVPPG